MYSQISNHLLVHPSEIDFVRQMQIHCAEEDKEQDRQHPLRSSREQKKHSMKHRQYVMDRQTVDPEDGRRREDIAQEVGRHTACRSREDDSDGPSVGSHSRLPHLHWLSKEKEHAQKTSLCSSRDWQDLVEHFHSDVDRHTEDDQVDGRREDTSQVVVVRHMAFGSKEDNPDSPVRSSPEGW